VKKIAKIVFLQLKPPLVIEPKGPICEAAPMVLSTPYPARLFQEQKINFSFWQTLSTSLRASARNKKLIFLPETLMEYNFLHSLFLIEKLLNCLID